MDEHFPYAIVPGHRTLGADLNLSDPDAFSGIYFRAKNKNGRRRTHTILVGVGAPHHSLIEWFLQLQSFLVHFVRTAQYSGCSSPALSMGIGIGRSDSGSRLAAYSLNRSA